MKAKTENQDGVNPAGIAEQAEELLTKRELAQRLKVSGRRIEQDPNMPVIRWGPRLVRYDWADVLAYLRNQ